MGNMSPVDSINPFVKYLSLMKFGIIFGNIFPLIAGFVLAGGSSVLLLLQVALFTSLVISCGCVLNNCYDADIDRLMQRTKSRVLACGKVSLCGALVFGFTLGACALVFGLAFVNVQAMMIAFFGLFCYVILYTIVAKRNSIFGVHVGSVAGAVPPLVGYASVNAVVDTPAIILFLMLIAWQVPHSFAIEIFRFDDYKNAKIPTVPNRKGLKWTKISMVVYTSLFALCNVFLFVFTNPIHWAFGTILTLWWIYEAFKGFYTANEIPLNFEWARKVFFLSIINIMGISLSIAFGIVF